MMTNPGRAALLFASSALLAAAPAAGQTTAADSTYELAAVETAPRPLNIPEFTDTMVATYPASLRDAGVAGRVTVRFAVDSSGATNRAAIISSSDTAFDAPTLNAVRTLRFSPARVRGRAVSAWVQLPIVWAVEGDKAAAPAPDGRPGLDRQPGVRELSEVDVMPRLRNAAEFISALERLFPPALRSSGPRGVVQLRFIVGADGKPSRITIVNSSDARFDQASIEAINTLRFSPARVGGQPVPVYVELPIDWRITQ